MHVTATAAALYLIILYYIIIIFTHIEYENISMKLSGFIFSEIQPVSCRLKSNRRCDE